MARVAAGNFLVLTLLCRHIRTDLARGEVPAFLHRLATDGARDKLGFIYEEFWHRITARLARADLQVLCDVAGVLVAAYGPLTADVIAGVLGPPRRRLGLRPAAPARIPARPASGEGEEVETFYRIYHESFADFLRTKTAVDRPRYRRRLGDYCADWGRHEGYGTLYSLQFGPRHLVQDRRWGDLEELLLDPGEVRSSSRPRRRQASFSKLAADFAAAAHGSPAGSPRARLYRLIGEALRRDLHFLLRHPHCLFQCLWNSCWWYDCPEAERHYRSGNAQRSGDARDPDRQEAKLYEFLEAWRSAKLRDTPGHLWLRSLRPPAVRLGSPLHAILRSGEGAILGVAIDPDSRHLASGSFDATMWIWDLTTGTQLMPICGHEGPVYSVAFSPDGHA